MKAFKIVSINIFGILIVLLPFILPISVIKKGFSSSNTENYYKKNSNHIKKFSVKAARLLYMDVFREIIQYDENCFSISKKLVYVPTSNSSCWQNNYEFLVKLNFGKDSNRLDNFGYVLNPKIIIIGDSHGMGWGVSEDNIFTSKLNENNFNSLNLSVSSYGTAKELIRLREWFSKNQSKGQEIETVIIQYNSNDLYENKAFLNKRLSIENPSDSILNRYKTNLGKENKFHLPYQGNIKPKFYPLIIKKFYVEVYKKIKRTKRVILYSIKKALGYNKPGQSLKAKHAINFFGVLDHFSDLIKDKNLIIFVSNNHGYGNKEISQEFQNYLETNLNDNFKHAYIMKTSETSLHADSDSYFLIDDHISELGHKRLGKAILKRLSSINP